MKFIYFLTLFLLIIFASCKQSGTPAKEKNCELSGTFMNMTLLDRCPDKMPYDIPNFAHELSFKVKDTVEISNGFEKFRLPYTGPEQGCQYKIIGATQFGDMYFSILEDSVLHLFDSAWTKMDRHTLFERITVGSREHWSFDSFLNECVISGTYLFGETGQKPRPVNFLSNGQVLGLKNFLSYKLCYAGDCLEETDPPSNTIEFTDDRANLQAFVYKMPNGSRSVIQFYSIGDPIKDQKGGRSIGAMAFAIKAQ